MCLPKLSEYIKPRQKTIGLSKKETQKTETQQWQRKASNASNVVPAPTSPVSSSEGEVSDGSTKVVCACVCVCVCVHVCSMCMFVFMGNFPSRVSYHISSYIIL